MGAVLRFQGLPPQPGPEALPVPCPRPRAPDTDPHSTSRQREELPADPVTKEPRKKGLERS